MYNYNSGKVFKGKNHCSHCYLRKSSGGSGTLDREIWLKDNKNIYFGDDKDLQIYYHPGNNDVYFQSAAGLDDINFNVRSSINFYTGGWAGPHQQIFGDGGTKIGYLGGNPASMANGVMWMETDGLHIYYNGAEKVVAGV